MCSSLKESDKLRPARFRLSTTTSLCRGRFRTCRAVMHHFHFFSCDQSAADHSVEKRQEGIYFFFAVDDFDYEGEVHGQAQKFGSVQPAGFAEAHGATQDGGAGEVQFARFEHDGFVERLVLPLVAFTDENAEEDGVLGDLHINFLSSN